MTPRPPATVALAALLLTAIPSTGGAADGRSLLNLLPPGTQIVVGLNMARVRRSPLFKEWRSTIRKDKKKQREYDNFVDKVGVDPASDLETLALGAVLDEKASERWVVVAEGNISPKRVREAIKREAKGGLLERKHAGQDYLLSRREGFALSLAPGRAVFAQEPALKGVLDRQKKSGRSAASDAALRRLADRAAPGVAAWLVATLPDSIRVQAGGGPAGALTAAREVIGTIELKTGLDVRVVAICPDDGIAAGLEQALRMLVVTLQDNPQLPPNASGLLSKVKTQVKGRDLIVELNLSVAELQALIDAASKGVEASRRPPRPVRKGRPLPKKAPKKAPKKRTKRSGSK